LLLASFMVLPAAACNRQAETPPAATNPPPAVQESPERRDARITTGVQAKLYSEEAVRGRDIAVIADQSIVTLRGSVDSDAAKQRALSLARDVEGVTEVRDELRVQTATVQPRRSAARGAAGEQRGEDTPTTGTNETVEPGWTTTKIQAQYFVNPEIKPWNIDVTTSSNGVVTLEGEVESADDRREAVRIAQGTEGVTRVEDRLRIKGEAAPAGTTGTDVAAGDRPDVWLTAKVQSKYFLDDLVKGRNINVDTQNGVVALKGSVRSEAERRRAVALARTTEGVRSVNDQLTMDPKMREGETPGSAAAGRNLPSAQRPDLWVTMKIQSQYFLDPEVKGHRIDVETNRGLVTLKGTVASDALKQQAERIARETEGVSRVINQLTVGKP
jgi:hyperosmotically inducible protein